MDKELAERIQELQLIEQNLQGVLIQKQSIHLEMNESVESLEELNNAKGDVYKIVGQIMIKSKKEDLKKDLESKRDISELKMKNFDKQETMLREKLEKLRDVLMKNLK